MRAKLPKKIAEISLRLGAGDTTLRQEARRLGCSTAQLKQQLYGIPAPAPEQEVRRAA